MWEERVVLKAMLDRLLFCLVPPLNHCTLCLILPSSTTSTPDKKVAERRTRSTECLQKMHEASKRRYSPVLALRDAVRADRESLSQSVDISVLSEKAASILGIAPPKQFKRASMYDPLLEQRIETETIPSRRSHSFHPSSHSIGLKKTRSQSQHFDKVVRSVVHTQPYLYLCVCQSR